MASSTSSKLGAIPAGTSTVDSAAITNNEIVNEDVNASAAIAGSKINPDFGSQNVVTTGNVGIGTSAVGSPALVKKDQNSITQLAIQNADNTASGAGAANLNMAGGGVGQNQATLNVVAYAGNHASFPSEVHIRHEAQQPLRIGNNGDASTGINITYSGGTRVGIGTSNPDDTFHVNGGLRLQNGGDSLNHYEEGTFSFSVGNTSGTMSGRFTRVGRFCAVRFDSFTLTVTASATLTSIATAWPSSIRGDGAVVCVVANVLKNGSPATAVVQIYTSGRVDMYDGSVGTHWTASDTIQFTCSSTEPGSLVYHR